jgi:hypothetical protein
MSDLSREIACLKKDIDGLFVIYNNLQYNYRTVLYGEYEL